MLMVANYRFFPARPGDFVKMDEFEKDYDDWIGRIPLETRWRLKST